MGTGVSVCLYISNCGFCLYGFNLFDVYGTSFESAWVAPFTVAAFFNCFLAVFVRVRSTAIFTFFFFLALIGPVAKFLALIALLWGVLRWGVLDDFKYVVANLDAVF